MKIKLVKPNNYTYNGISFNTLTYSKAIEIDNTELKLEAVKAEIIENLKGQASDLFDNYQIKDKNKEKIIIKRTLSEEVCKVLGAEVINTIAFIVAPNTITGLEWVIITEI